MLYASRVNAKSWWRCLEKDLAWVASLSTHLAEFRGASMHTWVSFFKKQGAKALAPIRCALMTDLDAKVRLEQAAAAPAFLNPLVAQWACVQCGDRFHERQAWASHCAREHGEKRCTRAIVVGAECLVCLRRLANRGKLLAHLHWSSPVCLVDTMLNYVPEPAHVVAQADERQAAAERDLQKRCEHATYSDELAAQAFGPIWLIVTPEGYRPTKRMILIYEATRTV